MTEIKVPTDGEKTATANVLKNIHELLKRGLFFGENAGYVSEAMAWLDKCVKDMLPAPKEESKEPQTPEDCDRAIEEMKARKAKLTVCEAPSVPEEVAQDVQT